MPHYSFYGWMHTKVKWSHLLQKVDQHGHWDQNCDNFLTYRKSFTMITIFNRINLPKSSWSQLLGRRPPPRKGSGRDAHANKQTSSWSNTNTITQTHRQIQIQSTTHRKSFSPKAEQLGRCSPVGMAFPTRPLGPSSYFVNIFIIITRSTCL